jgi:predicted RNA methylase
MAQDTGKQRTNLKDQYYTKESVAKRFVNTILQWMGKTNEYLWIEPSAGTGSFLKALPPTIERIGLDLDPKASGILQQDFLTWTPPPTSKPIVVFGNPPFGRQGSLAKAFLRHACSFAQVVAFILPRSFDKPSMSNCIPLHFYCFYSMELQNNSFEVNGESYTVPCVFQIWEKKDTLRRQEPSIEAQGYQYVKPPQSYDIAFRRVGANAGHCSLPPGDFNLNTHYFFKFDEKYKEKVLDILVKLNQNIFLSNTTGPKSISKSEANTIVNGVLSQV